MPPTGTASTSVSVASAFPALASAADPATTTGTIRAAPPSPNTEFSFWRAQFRLLGHDARRIERSRLSRIKAALQTASDDEREEGEGGEGEEGEGGA
jgi:hypothetical protein